MQVRDRSTNGGYSVAGHPEAGARSLDADPAADAFDGASTSPTVRLPAEISAQILDSLSWAERNRLWRLLRFADQSVGRCVLVPPAAPTRREAYRTLQAAIRMQAPKAQRKIWEGLLDRFFDDPTVETAFEAASQINLGPTEEAPSLSRFLQVCVGNEVEERIWSLLKSEVTPTQLGRHLRGICLSDESLAARLQAVDPEIYTEDFISLVLAANPGPNRGHSLAVIAEKVRRSRRWSIDWRRDALVKRVERMEGAAEHFDWPVVEVLREFLLPEFAVRPRLEPLWFGAVDYLVQRLCTPEISQEERDAGLRRILNTPTGEYRLKKNEWIRRLVMAGASLSAVPGKATNTNLSVLVGQTSPPILEGLIAGSHGGVSRPAWEQAYEVLERSRETDRTRRLKEVLDAHEPRVPATAQARQGEGESAGRRRSKRLRTS